CFFASFKTLLMPTEPIRSRRNQCPGRRYPLAGFEVIIIGRFWVITEALVMAILERLECGYEAAHQQHYHSV
ncbi:MAG TPA: hypothetical protein VE422_02525, partial [Terriglobia bacterium]|nr:hypothetical protein [Terriglobia bacterium]